jgi:hypothetical protein
MSAQEVLTDLKLWMQRRLESSQAPRSNSAGFHGTNKTNGYVVVEVPDWEMRQKLEAVEEALKTVDFPPPCPRCDERDQAEGEAYDGMTNAAEIAGLQ